jgi:DNA polymerase II small subunit
LDPYISEKMSDILEEKPTIEEDVTAKEPPSSKSAPSPRDGYRKEKPVRVKTETDPYLAKEGIGHEILTRKTIPRAPSGIQGISRSVSDIMKHRSLGPGIHSRPTGPGGRPRPLASEYDGDLRIIKDTLAGMGGQGKIEDFQKLFMDRFRSLRDLLVRQYGALSPCIDIGNLRGSEDTVRFIGMVESVRTTKNGHTMINIEDPTGTIRVLISKKKRDLFSIKVVNDEVIGISGKYKSGDRRGGSIVFADQIFKADIPGTHRRRLSEVKGLTAAFTSDIHIGSKMYLEKEWNKMVKWLRGERNASLPAKDGTRVKYLILAGDLVDGIGTYPDQDKDLLIKDIFKQYEALGESLSMLPDHLEIILIPGNHDAVRLAEPQPPLPKEYQECFSNAHLHFLPNPAFFSIHGVHVTGYHGRSLDDLVTLFKDVTYEDPIEGMREMLRFRHFSPTYGMRNQISPEERDLLIIDEVPDIFVSGHVHRFGMDNYKGVQLIEGSTWQSQTQFQKMMNFKPQPARMGIVELDLPDSMQGWSLT